MQTKITILTERAANLRTEAGKLLAEAERIERELSGLARTPFGKPCNACGTMLATERDFAEHFRVDNPLWPNLGECPIGHPVEQYPALARAWFAAEAARTGQTEQYIAAHQRRGLGEGRVTSIHPSQYTDNPGEYDCNHCGLRGGH